MILTQIEQGATEAVEVARQTISIWELTLKGGITMIPLAILWVIAIYLFRIPQIGLVW